MRVLPFFVPTLLALAAAPAVAREHSALQAAGPQEPAAVPTGEQAQVSFETKLPERPVIPWVFAHDAGDEAQEVSFEERQRRALLYSSGFNLVNLALLEHLLGAEAARRAAAQERVGGEQVDDAAVDAKVQEQVDIFLAAVPNGDFWAQRLVEGYTPDAYRRTVALVMKVADMYFPPDPEQWPVPLLEQIFHSGEENSHWLAVKEELDGRIGMKQRGEAFAPMPSDFVFSYVMLPGVLAWLREHAQIEYPSSGLPEGVSLRVDGKEFATADLLEQARPLLTPVAEEQAAVWVEAVAMAEQDLREGGHWLSKATLDAMWDAERADYEGTIFSHEQTVLEFLGFPSMEHYRQYFEARMSFRTTLPDPLPKEWIQAAAVERAPFLGYGKVQAQVILIAAVEPSALEYSVNPKIFRAGDDPFGQYHATALEVAQLLQDGEKFEDLLLEYSNFPPRAPGNNALQRDRGRFDLLSRSDLRMLLGESDFSDVLQGYSIGDDIFFHGEVGAVYGPVRGPLGWYFYRVTKREPPVNELDPDNDPRQAYQLEDDLLTRRFLAFLNGLRG